MAGSVENLAVLRIAQVQIDGGAAKEIDLYSPTTVYQPIVYTASLADGQHTLTVTVTGRKNAASTSARIVVDAFDVYTPGRRYEEWDRTKVTYGGVNAWTFDSLLEAEVLIEARRIDYNEHPTLSTHSAHGDATPQRVRPGLGSSDKRSPSVHRLATRSHRFAASAH